MGSKIELLTCILATFYKHQLHFKALVSLKSKRNLTRLAPICKGKAKGGAQPPNIEGISPSSFVHVAKALDINDIIKFSMSNSIQNQF